jgi:hypothetical protein
MVRRRIKVSSNSVVVVVPRGVSLVFENKKEAVLEAATKDFL